MVIVVLLVALVVAPIAWPSALAAQAHDHTASAPAPDARLQLVLGGPHLIQYHAGYLALGETQVAGLQRLRRTVCDAEVVYVERTAAWRERIAALLADDAASLAQASSAAPACSSESPMAPISARPQMQRGTRSGRTVRRAPRGGDCTGPIRVTT
jgi:hypothetical protein